MDEDGQWFWYAVEPEQYDAVWGGEGSRLLIGPEHLTAWGDQSFTRENSLIARPVDDLKRMEGLRHPPQQLTSFGVVYLQHATDGTLICNKYLEAERPAVSAASILEAGLQHMRDRAATYDKPEGERSMGATVRMFEAATGIVLTEEQGWLLMCCLKMVRAQSGNLRMDSYEDGAAYFALAGESAVRDRASNSTGSGERNDGD
jgi:hypothetical protein